MAQSLLANLEARLAAEARVGRTARFGEAASLELTLGSVHALARTEGAWSPLSTSAVALAPWRCGESDVLVAALAEGNYKDEGTAIAAGLALVSLLDHAQRPLLSQADVVPALRRVMLDAHERILEASRLPLAGRSFGTAAGPRNHLRGLGCSLSVALFALPNLYSCWLGECGSWLVRNQQLRQLTVPHTLAQSVEGRSLIDSGQLGRDEAAGILLKVLGTNEQAPNFEVTRLALDVGDRFVLGNENLSSTMLATSTTLGLPELIDKVAGELRALPYGPPQLAMIAAEVAASGFDSKGVHD